MKTQVQIHTVKLSGGYVEETPQEFLKHFEKVGKFEHYLSSWNRPKSVSKEDWEELIKEENQEDTRKMYPRYDDIRINIQDKDLVTLLMARQDRVTIENSEMVDVNVELETDSDRSEAYFLKTMKVMEKYQDQLEKLSTNTFNQKCGQHTGGIALAEYNQLKLKEDVCTDELQQELKSGWRILAVCPQPDQRRPDYILGKKVESPQDSALR